MKQEAAALQAATKELLRLNKYDGDESKVSVIMKVQYAHDMDKSKCGHDVLENGPKSEMRALITDVWTDYGALSGRWRVNGRRASSVTLRGSLKW